MYRVPQASILIQDIEECFENTTGEVSLNFSLPQTLVRITTTVKPV